MASYLYPQNNNNNNNSFDNITIDNGGEDGANKLHLDNLNNNKNVLMSSSFANPSTQPQIVYAQQVPPPQIIRVTDSSEGGTVSFVLFIIGFFFPLCWLVNLINIKSRNSRSKKFSILSIIFFCALVVIIIIGTVSTR